MPTLARPAVLLAAAAAHCSPAPVPTDAAADVTTAPDAAPARTAEIRAADERARVTLAAGPVRLRVDHPDGAPWLASPAAMPFLEVGTAAGGPSPVRFHDPRVRNPPGIEWRVPALVADGTTERTLALDDARAGRVTLALENVAPGVFRVAVEARGADAAMLRFHFAADDGAYHGLGERFGAVDARGQLVPMQLHLGGYNSGTNEIHVPVPFFVSTKGYGVFVQTREAGAFDVAASDPSRVTATFEGRRADVYLFTDPDPLRVVAAYTRLAGLPRLPPRWVYGPQQWRNAWTDADEMLGDARRLRAEGIPTTTMWIDNPWQVSYNDHEIDTARFPDPPALFHALTRMGYRVLVWSTPYLDAVDAGATPRNTAERLFLQAREQGWLVRMPDGSPFVSPSNPGNPAGMDARGGMVDFSAPAASAFWTSRLEPLVDLGVRGFKLDYGEDVIVELLGARPRFQFASGETERTMHSRYPQLYHAAYRAALDRRAGGDGFLLVRASSWGGQAVADVVWPGDLDNDFRTHEGREVGGLPAAINGMLSLAASGFPNFASDTGGYRGGMPTREALLRWAEHTAVSMVMQLGGGGISHNPWAYDPEAVAIYRGLARLHNDLVPYLRVHALAASRDGTPPVRALALAFPDDPGARADGYAYLLGDDLLMAPVVTPGATTRRVHLPRGTWVHWFDGSTHTGPAEVEVPAPLGRPPLFLRQGAVVPLLADDVATLASTDDPGVVDADDRRAVLRARIVPAGSREVTLEDGARIAVEEGAAGMLLAFAPGREASELRAEVDWAHRGAGGSAAVTAVEREDGGALAEATDETTVARGCDGCWFFARDRGVLRIAVRGAARVRVR